MASVPFNTHSFARLKQEAKDGYYEGSFGRFPHIRVEKRGDRLKINVYADAAKTAQCLLYEVQQYGGETIGKVVQVVGLPGLRGTDVMKLVDEMAVALGVTYNRLDDRATVKSATDKTVRAIRLAWIHLFKHGITWYQSLGYHPQGVDEMRYRLAVREIRKRRFFDFLREMIIAGGADTTMLEELYVGIGDPALTVGEFFVLVWERYPSKYQEAFNQVFESGRGPYSWQASYNYVLNNIANQVKYY
jgi:hypothetical protein